jgi:fibronectin-binding autotransporter adhesin
MGMQMTRANQSKHGQRRRVLNARATKVVCTAAMCIAGYTGYVRGADNTYSWIGPATAGGNVSWAFATNWAGGVAPPLVPAAGDNSILVFGGNLNTGTSAQSTGDLNIYQLQIGTYAIAGGTTMTLSSTGSASRTLRIGAGGIVYDIASGGTVSVQNSSSNTDARIILTADQTWNTVQNNSTGNLIIRRPIDDRILTTDPHGGFRITKEGAGTLQLSQPVTVSNTFTGGVVLNDGNIRLDTSTGELGTGPIDILSGKSVGIAASGSAVTPQPFVNQFNLGGGGTFNLRGSWEMLFNGTLNFQGPIAMNVPTPGGAGAGIHTVNGALTGAGAFTKTGGGTLLLSDTATADGFSGNLAVINGVLSAKDFNQLGTAATPITLGASAAGVGTTTINSGTLLIRTADQSTSRGVFLDNGGGNLDYAGALTINNAITGTGPLTKVGAGNLNINAIRTDGVLTSTTGTTKIAAGGGSAGTSIVGGLVLGGGAGAWTSALDITDHGLVVNYPDGGPSPIATIADQIKSGRNGGSWNGNGINSSVAAGSASLAIGYAESSQAVGAGGGTFAGQSVDGSAVLARTTYAGDSNLDGKVDLTDFTFLAANFNTNGGAQWLQGDYNYDGNVDLTDFTFLASNFNKSLPADGGGSTLGTMVPEPASLVSALAMGVTLLGAGRRRREV